MKRMIPLNPITLLLAALALGVLAAPSLAQSGAIYTITSSTVDSGGGTSSSATYTLGGTVGQHDAGDPSGTTYTVLGGFWVPTFVIPEPLESGPNPWAPDPLGGDLNRTGSFKMPTAVVAAAGEVAIRVKVVDIYDEGAGACPVRVSLPDLSPCVGQIQYLGPPSAFDDNDITVTPKFVAAELQDAPFYRDWSPSALTTLFGASVDTDAIYFYGQKVLPCSEYDVQQGSQSCVESASPDGCLSEALVVKTALLGDVWAPFGLVNFTDIGQVVDAWKSIPFVEAGPGGAPRKVRAMLRGDSAPLGTKLNFTDIGETVDAWKTIAYQRDCQ